MNYTFTFLLLVLTLIGTPALAQKDAKKIFVARINGRDTSITKRDRDEIAFQARDKLVSLQSLLNALKTIGLNESERNSIIQNSYLPNQDQIFYNDGVIVEDDIDPKHISSATTADLSVERYLRNFDLFYVKSDDETISFSRKITSSLIEGKSYLFIKIFFTSTFKGKHTQFDTPYQPLQRVAELRAEKTGDKWQTLITRLGFLQPDEKISEDTRPVIPKDFGPQQPINGKLYLYRSINDTSDSVAAKWDKKWLNIVRSTTDLLPVGFYQYRRIDNTSQAYVSVTLTNKERLLSFRQSNGSIIGFGQVVKSGRLAAWLQIATGMVALGASYAGYNSLQNSYKAYNDQLTTLNSEYAIWQTLTQQPGGNPAAPMAFGSYAKPGIYAVYGGGVAGSALLVNGIRQLVKARKLKKQSGK